MKPKSFRAKEFLKKLDPIMFKWVEYKVKNECDISFKVYCEIKGIKL